MKSDLSNFKYFKVNINENEITIISFDMRFFDEIDIDQFLRSQSNDLYHFVCVAPQSHCLFFKYCYEIFIGSVGVLHPKVIFGQ